MDRAIAMEGERQKSDDDEVFFFQKKKDSRRKNPWLTPTGSSASDETEEEEVKPVRAPHGLSDPIGEDVKGARLDSSSCSVA